MNFTENIRGKPKYYSTGEVAKELGENDSTIRYWCDQFDDFLQIERVGAKRTRRQFTQGDIEKLEYVKHLLREETLSIRQVKEFLSTSNPEGLTSTVNEKEQIMIEALANAVLVQIDKKFDEKFEEKFRELENTLLQVAKIEGDAQREFREIIDNKLKESKETIQEDISNKLEESQHRLREELALDRESIKDIIAQEISTGNEENKTHIKEFEATAVEREEKLLKYIKEIRNKKEENHGFFRRLFRK